eukprot:jgi/Botrbrau1/13823/Bobra.0056s0065.1
MGDTKKVFPMIASPMVVTGPPAASSGWVKALKDIFAGTCGGISVTLVGHPFDTVKVRLQTQPSTNPIYSGVVDCVRKTIQWEGLPGLYKGVTSPLAGQMFFRATLFGAFGASKRYFGTDANSKPRPLTDLDLYKVWELANILQKHFSGVSFRNYFRGISFWTEAVAGYCLGMWAGYLALRARGSPMGRLSPGEAEELLGNGTP